MQKYVVLEKPIGQTPLEALTAWKEKMSEVHTEYADMPASYAGRLDPMASGLLLVLLGDECKQRARYEGLDKEYEIEVLLDAGSDTGDVLGLVEYGGQQTNPTPAALRAALRHVRGAHTVPYPAFSSKTVAGKPLFMYALEGTLDTIDLPTHEETIYSIQYTGTCTLSQQELARRVQGLLALTPTSDEPSKALGADFRIHDVRNSWQPIFLEDRRWTVLRLRVTCASGTYMRTLANRLAVQLSTRALCLSIHRTRIGRYQALPFGFWRSTFRKS